MGVENYIFGLKLGQDLKNWVKNSQEYSPRYFLGAFYVRQFRKF